MMLIAFLLLIPSLVWADADLPNLPAEYNPGYVTPTTATSKSVCATVNITGASNASPIVITTAGHKWTTGQTVIIASVGGNTAANGTRVITKISATQFSLNGTTGNGAYTSGGTAACDYSSLQTALDTEAPAGNVTIYLNQGETYVGTTNTNTFRAGIIIPTKTSTNWTVLRTWDDGSGNLPAQEERVKMKHAPYLAKIANGTAGGASVSNGMSCDERANYYWIKQIELVRPIPQAEGGGLECLNGYGAGGQNPPRKWIKNITESGGVTTVLVDAGKMQGGANTGGHLLSVNVDISFTCAQCAGIGLSGSYNVTGISKRVVTVTGATNANPIVITTGEDHDWVTNQQVDIASVGGNTAANGSRTITRIDARNFSLNGIAGNGDYTSGGTIQSKFPDQFTINATLTGAYSYNAADYAGVALDSFPSHMVFEQFLITTPNFSNVAGTRQGVTSGADLAGEDIVFRQSHIDVCGSSAGEFGRGILMALDGPRRAVVENNYISGCAFSVFLDANPMTFNQIPTDITFRGNTMTIGSRVMTNRMDTSSSRYKDFRTVKNIFETKAGLRVRLTGNTFSRGFADGQSTMLHFTNRHNYVLSNQCGLVASGAEGEGCHPGNTLADITMDSNVAMNIGQHCFDIIGQSSFPGTTPGLNEYPSLRTTRFRIHNNLWINCSGYGQPRYSTTSTIDGGGAIALTGGPMHVTVTHNTITVPERFHAQWSPIKHYCGPADNPANGSMINTDGVTRTGDWSSCTQSNSNGHNETGKSPYLTVKDNIFWVASTSNAAWGTSTTSGGSLVRCARSDMDDATRVAGVGGTGVWHHNILVGTIGTLNSTNCDMNVIPGTQVLATGSQIVANQAAMNYLNLPGHVYKLTASSPGYQAASDGTDIGVNWDTLMAAVGGWR